MLPADSSAMPPKVAAILVRNVDNERSPPLSVTLNGRPKGRIIAEISDIVTAGAVSAWVTSMKSGSVRWFETQPL